MLPVPLGVAATNTCKLRLPSQRALGRRRPRDTLTAHDLTEIRRLLVLGCLGLGFEACSTTLAPPHRHRNVSNASSPKAHSRSHAWYSLPCRHGLRKMSRYSTLAPPPPLDACPAPCASDTSEARLAARLPGTDDERLAPPAAAPPPPRPPRCLDALPLRRLLLPPLAA